MCSISHNSTPAGIGEIEGPAIPAQILIRVKEYVVTSVAVYLEGYSLMVFSYGFEFGIEMVSPMH